ncbi:hypothetical protein CSB45_11420 [candidate division KSB3 bacterium]|uniref:Uncharacterized protein n=1 Tax=candidate division KSB3 bacterium TaxID=2044937 RepID=A0A2G6E2W8_9BACT|nr:MAG: hypothetical protein CSB45_11420 [candidate division KSB3 bacterium]PIE28920.1 MAG: hypothetical protein CSA57_11465 [candidate division KSB3 bacterium]
MPKRRSRTACVSINTECSHKNEHSLQTWVPCLSRLEALRRPASRNNSKSSKALSNAFEKNLDKKAQTRPYYAL